MMDYYDWNYEWDEDKNEDVAEAIAWAEWLIDVKDPGPALLVAAKKHAETLLLAAKKHAETFLKCYRMMNVVIQDSENGVV